VEALVLPEAVDLRRNILRPAAQAAELGDPLIADLEGRELARQHIEIILRVGARARNRPDVDDELDGAGALAYPARQRGLPL
jgi:hypothetical protein